jgi:hypothetical protein
MNLRQFCRKLVRPRQVKSLTKKQRLKIIHFKDILTVEEASLYLEIPPGVLLEEVGLGRLPGGILAGEWRFCREALINHFSIYHGNGPWINYGTVDENNDVESCDQEVVEKLLKNYKNGERDFSDLDLRGADLSHADLSESDFYGSWLSRANFEGSILKDVDFRKAHLREANLQGADLKGASLQDADLTEADLSRAILVGTDLRDAILLGVNLTGANLEGTRFR